MHQSTGRWKLGLALSLTTAFLWGVLPIALKGVLVTIDAVTITWYRFIVSVALVALILYRRNRLPNTKWLKDRKLLLLFILVIIGLSSNYILYLMGLNLVTPSAAQVVIQIAPLLLLIGGLVVFKEEFSRLQWAGVLMFLLGLGLFFNHRLDSILQAITTTDGDQNYAWGLLLILIAAVTWAAYALSQKQLLLNYGSQQIMFIAYIAASLLFFPSAEVFSVSALTGVQWILLLFCCLNTFIAYGSFAEALEHWEASRVGAVLAITPLITIACAYFTSHLFPGYITIESVNTTSLLGAGILVLGSLIAALAKRKKSN